MFSQEMECSVVFSQATLYLRQKNNLPDHFLQKLFFLALKICDILMFKEIIFYSVMLWKFVCILKSGMFVFSVIFIKEVEIIRVKETPLCLFVCYFYWSSLALALTRSAAGKGSSIMSPSVLSLSILI